MPLKLGNLEISCFGHDTCLISNGKINIYTDPYVIPKDAPKADIILISHDHYDHLSLEKIDQVKKDNVVFVTNEVCCMRLEGNIKSVGINETIEVNGVKITGVEAYTIGNDFHPKGKGIGFVIELDGKRIYFSGDTDLIPEMKELGKIDLAFLPISGTYVMTLDEAVEAVKTIKPEIAVPIHYNVLDDSEADPEEFKKKLEGISKVEILYR